MRFTELATSITDRPGPVRLVAIDGPGGAGKSTFAAHLAASLDDAPVVHTDDFASWEQPIDWWPRLLEQVIEPLAAGTPARYQRYDWVSRSLAEWHEVEPRPVVIIEGVSSGRSEWRHHLSFVVWIETPHAERLRRGLERGGADALDDWERWGAAEDAHYAADPTRPSRTWSSSARHRSPTVSSRRSIRDRGCGCSMATLKSCGSRFVQSS